VVNLLYAKQQITLAPSTFPLLAFRLFPTPLEELTHYRGFFHQIELRPAFLP
jgi:hypothetical protein